MKTIKIDSTAGLAWVAQELLTFAQGEKFFVFEGEMGAGKTTFIKVFCELLGVKDLVSSPTFSIVNEYQGNLNLVNHFDFYRLKNIQEAYDIGYEEYFYSDNYCLVEWPQKVSDLLPLNYIKVQIDVIGQAERTFSFTRLG
jgi:tRNA threonylcarbamoyladenosine biosynthesis protein TsaE